MLSPFNQIPAADWKLNASGLVVPAGGATLDPRNRLAFPCGVAAGFDPSIVSGLIGSYTNQIKIAPKFDVRSFGTLAIDRIMGPVQKGSTTADTTVIAPSAGSPFFFAQIISLGDITTTVQLLNWGSGGGWRTNVFNSSLEIAANGVAQFFNVVPLPLNVPVLILASGRGDGSKVCALLLRLDNGQIFTGSATGSTPPNAGSASLAIVGQGSPSWTWAATFAARTFVDLPQMQMLANDPWAFWYPQVARKVRPSNVVELRPAKLPVGTARQPRLPRSRFAYPVGMAPGVNKDHPASQNLAFSILPISGSYVDLVTAKKATNTQFFGVPATKILSFGPGLSFASGTGYNTSFAAGAFRTGGLPITLAAIVQHDDVNNLEYYLHGESYGPGNVGPRLGYYFGGGGMVLVVNATAIQSSLRPSVGVPYFAAVTYDGSKAVFVLKRLDNGSVKTQTVSSSVTMSAPDGGAVIGSASGLSTSNMIGTILAGMYAYTGLSLAQLLQWADDPWSFWYPNSHDVITPLVSVPQATVAAPAPTSTNVALAALAAAMGWARSAWSGATSLRGTGTAASNARAQAGGSTPLSVTGYATAMSQARAGGKFSTGLSVKAVSASFAKSAQTVTAGLLARSVSVSRSSANMARLAALAAFGKASAGIRSTTGGVTSLTARAVSASFGKVVPPGSIALIARSIASAFMRANVKGSASLSVKSTATGWAGATPSGRVGLAAFSKSASQAASKITAVIALPLSGAASLSVSFARATFNLLAIVTSMARRVTGTFAGYEKVTGTPMLTVHDPYEFVCGDTWQILVTLTDADGNPLDLTNVQYIEWKLDDLAGVTNIITLILLPASPGLSNGIALVGQPTEGKALIKLTDQQTEAIVPGAYRDQCRVKLADGTASTQFVGVITALADY